MLHVCLQIYAFHDIFTCRNRLLDHLVPFQIIPYQLMLRALCFCKLSISNYNYMRLSCFTCVWDWKGHDDVIKWKYFPRYWPFICGIHWSPVNSPHKGQWRGALMYSLISAWINGWVNNREAGDLRRRRAHYDVTVMIRACVTMCRPVAE